MNAQNKAVLRQILRVFLGEVVMILLMLLVHLLLDRLNKAVVLGAVLGGLLAIGNFIALSISVSLAADQAQETGDAKKAQLTLQGGTLVRLLVVAGLYIVILRTGVCDVLSSILPLVFVQFSITLTEFFRKGGDA